MIEVTGSASPEVLSKPALAFVEELHRAFESRRQELLQKRLERYRRLAAGAAFDFLPETASVRAGDWKVAPPPADLEKRHVEITGPVERKMMINALNSGADVFMSDFEDSLSPTWSAVVQGHANLKDAVRRKLTFTSPEGKSTSSTRRSPRCWSGHAAGTCRRNIFKSTASRSPARSPISGSSSSTTRARRWTGAPGPTSTCPRWSRTSKRGCGTTCSCSRRRSWESRAPADARRC